MKKHFSLTRRLALCFAIAASFLPASVVSASAADITSDETATITTTVYLGTKNGTLSSSTGSSTYYSNWQSTNLPALTLECSASNIENTSDTLALYSTGSSCTYNLKAADGWKIKSVSLELKNRYNTEAGATITLNGGTAQTITYAKQTFTVTGLSATTVPIVVTKGTTVYTGNNGNWVLISACAVTLERTTAGRAFTVDMSNGTLNNTSGYSDLWKSSSTDPVQILKAEANNMKADGSAIDLYAGSKESSSYIFSTAKEYAIAGYFLTFKNKATSSATVTLTANGTDYTVSDSAKSVFVDGLTYPSVSLKLAGDNHAVLFSNIQVVLAPRAAASQFTELYVTDYATAHPYRIPAIAKTHDGALLALSDYRVCGGDIGNGEVDIVARRSADNGKMWGTQFTIADGTSTCGYGDAALVADRESDNVLLICVSGKITYWNSKSTNRMPISRFTSSDNGVTWVKQTDLTDAIYNLFNGSSLGNVEACFLGSGRICQSQVVKVDKYYRLYAALCSRPGGNRVIYSDDFGATWKVLGDINTSPAPSGDEPKCEELPDGTVVLSSRMAGGRYFNFFTYSNVNTAAGSWGTVAASNTSNNGAYTNGNSTNGEILLLPATRNSDGKDLYVALQSVPLGNGRSDVAIHYKELSSLADVKDPSAFASNWDGKLQVSTIGSAYSTMILQKNDSIAFLFEESTYGYDYTTLYRAYSLEDITNGAYSYKSDVDRVAFVRDILKERATVTTPAIGKALGMYTSKSVVAVAQANASNAVAVLNIYDSNPTAQGYADAVAKIASDTSGLELTTIQPQEGVDYVLTNNYFTGYRIQHDAANSALKSVATSTTLDETQKFRLKKVDGGWNIYTTVTTTSTSTDADNNETTTKTTTNYYIAKSPVKDAQFTTTTSESDAAVYTFSLSTDGATSVTCTSPTTADKASLHLGSAGGNIIAWGQYAGGSKWQITPVEDDAIATARASLFAAISNACSYELGTGLGQYTDTATEDYTTALNSACSAANDMSQTQTADALKSATSTLTTAISGLKLNLPTAGTFLRVRASSAWKSTRPYLLCDTITSSQGKVAKFGNKSGVSSVFYYAGNKLLSYKTGIYAASTSTGYGFLTFTGVGSSTKVEFAAAANGSKSLYNLHYNMDSGCTNRQIYTGDNSTDNWANAAGAGTSGEGYNYELEEVTSLPVTITSAGWATLYAPVPLTIPDSVTAYTGVVSEDKQYLKLTKVEETIPAATPVVLEGTAGTYYFTIGEKPEKLIAETAGSDENILAGKVATSTKTEGDLTLQNNGGIGFYKYTGENLNGFKSYIESSNASRVNGLKFIDATTGIVAVTTEKTAPAEAVYDLQGRRVTNPGCGFYIIGGKKVFRF